MAKKLYLRADGSADIGLGHVVRLLALANMLKSVFELFFIIKNPSQSLINMIKSEVNNILILDSLKSSQNGEIEEVINIISDKSVCIVLDGYNFDTTYQYGLKSAGFKVVSIDDIHPYHFVSDVIINHSPGVSSLDYSCESYTKMYFGPDYALLRKPFLDQNKKSNKLIPSVKKIIICFGGSDPLNVSEKALKACLLLNNISEINIVLGSVNIHYNSIRQIVQQNPMNNVVIHENLSDIELISLILQNDLIICPSSTIAYEALCTSINIICGYYVDNQKEFFEYLEKKGFISGVGDWSILDINQIYDKLNFFLNSYKLIDKKKLIKSDPDQNIINLFLNIYDN